MTIFSSSAFSGIFSCKNCDIIITGNDKDVTKTKTIVKYWKNGNVKKVKTKTIVKKGKKSQGFKDDPNEEDTNSGSGGGFAWF